MNVELIIWFSLCKLTLAQMNGEFWWLNDKLKTNSAWASPKFEELSEFDTDESAKIIFNDNELFKQKVKGYDIKEKVNENDRLTFDMNFQDESNIMWPSEANAENCTKKNKLVEITTQPLKTGDVLEFKFPDDKHLIWNDNQANSTKTTSKTDKLKNINKKPNDNATLDNSVSAESMQGNKWDSENICTVLKKLDCFRKGGVVYFKRVRYSKKISMDSQLLCCILPLKSHTDEASKIHFIDTPFETNKRHKRSNEDETSQALKQRNVLLFKRYGAQFHKTTTPAPQKKVTQKIVTPENDYIDPYWNIKNTNFKKQHTVYASDDYVEDYVVEVPKPGLVGIYSEHKDSSWSFANGNSGSAYGDVVDDDGSYDDSNEEPELGYGGGFLDPRLEDRVAITTTKPILFGRPAKLKAETVSSEEITYNAASHTINYQSNPDFNVLQGFKLLKLFSNKSKIYKNERKTTTERVASDSLESVLIGSLEPDNDESFEASGQVYKDCGQVAKGSSFGKDMKIGETNRNSHPWLTLVTLTKKRQTILCYATIVHPRAAVTTADCVHGRACPGEVTLIAGAWDLEKESGEDWQKRMVSVEMHPRYTPGELDNNLAILYWKRPLRLGVTVQPACLADPHVGDDCFFAGWGGYDQGIGGPLICSVSGKHTAVGVAIWRNQAIVLTPPREWTLRTFAELHLY